MWLNRSFAAPLRSAVAPGRPPYTFIVTRSVKRTCAQTHRAKGSPIRRDKGQGSKRQGTKRPREQETKGPGKGAFGKEEQRQRGDSLDGRFATLGAWGGQRRCRRGFKGRQCRCWRLIFSLTRACFLRAGNCRG